MADTLKTYLIRAVYEWCCDNRLTPHIAVFVNEFTAVPRQYVQDNQIVLNIAPAACSNLLIRDDALSCMMRFGGKTSEIWIPAGHIIGIFARETGEGLPFEAQPYRPAPPDKTPGENTAARAAGKSGAEDTVSFKIVKKGKK